MRAAAELDDATEKHPVTPGALLPAREQLGELLLELKQPAAALEAVEVSFGSTPNPVRGSSLKFPVAARRAGSMEFTARPAQPGWLAMIRRPGSLIESEPRCRATP